MSCQGYQGGLRPIPGPPRDGENRGGGTPPGPVKIGGYRGRYPPGPDKIGGYPLRTGENRGVQGTLGDGENGGFSWFWEGPEIIENH